MDSRTRKVLSKIYHPKTYNREWDVERNCFVYHRPDMVSQGEWDALPAHLRPNKMELITHDEHIRRIRQATKQISEQDVTNGFILGCSGSWLRGRQTLISWSYAQHLQPHPFANSNPQHGCQHCGLPLQKNILRTCEKFWLHFGNVWNELPSNFVIDLEERTTLQSPPVTQKDIEIFTRLLESIDNGPAKETPGGLAQRLGREKRIPKSNKYVRYGILQALAEVGVLPNPLVSPIYERFVPRTQYWEASRKLQQNTRSDIVLPLAAWKGGVNWATVRVLFPNTNCNYNLQSTSPKLLS